MFILTGRDDASWCDDAQLFVSPPAVAVSPLFVSLFRL